MTNENTHGSEAVRQKMIDLAVMLVDRPLSNKTIVWIDAAVASLTPTTPPPLAGEGGEAAAYRVELDSKACAHCNVGETWAVVGSDGVAAGCTWQDEAEAEEYAAAMNSAFAAGQATLAPSQGMAVTDDVRDAARYRWLRKTHGERLLEFLWAWSFSECASEYIEQRFDQEIDAGMRDKGAALASAAVRDERVSNIERAAAEAFKILGPEAVDEDSSESVREAHSVLGFALSKPSQKGAAAGGDKVLDAWVKYEPAETPSDGNSIKESRRLRHAFYAGWNASAEAKNLCSYPQCSGDPACCPENEGYGCCENGRRAQEMTFWPVATPESILAAEDGGGAVEGLAEVFVDPEKDEFGNQSLSIRTRRELFTICGNNYSASRSDKSNGYWSNSMKEIIDVEPPSQAVVREVVASAVEWPSIDDVCAAAAREDAEFSTWRNSVPDKHWVRLDMSALRVGYELGSAVMRCLFENDDRARQEVKS